MKNLRPKLKFNFDFDEEIPELKMKPSPMKKKGEMKTKVTIHKKIKNGRRDSSTGLF